MKTIEEILKDGITPEQAYGSFCARSEEAAPLKKQAEELRECLPHIIDAAIEKAREAMDGLVLLPGNPEKSQIGNPPGWHEDPYHNREYVFQISRMNHWLPMLYSYAATGDERYARKIIDELMDWIKSCKREPLFDKNRQPRVSYFNSPQAKEWRVLECGIRPYKTWCPALEGLCMSEAFTQKVFETALMSLYEQCEVTYHVSPLSWPRADHNHYLMENLGLLSTSCMFPELKTADLWREHALKELNRCMDAQVDDQGAQIEGCPSYHNGCIYWFAMVLVYGRRYHLEIPESYREKFSLMAAHSIYATRPCGTNVPWGDTSTLTGTLSAAAVSTCLGTEDGSYLAAALHFYGYEALLTASEAYIWQMEHPAKFCAQIQKALETMKSKKGKQKPDETEAACITLPLLCHNPVLKHVYFRTSWQKDALSVMFACRCPIQNLHAHIDPCGFDFTAYGVPMVVDPGKYTYQDGEDRKNFKSMAWHNTLTVNHSDAWEYLGSWAYGKQREGTILGSGQEGSMMWAVASHENYSPVIHTRGIALVDNEFLLVTDLVENLGPEDSIQLQFHVDRPSVGLEATDCGIRGTARWEGGQELAILSTLNQAKVIPARVSDRNDTSRPSSILQYTERDTKHRPGNTKIIATLLYPCKESPLPAVSGLHAALQNDGSGDITADVTFLIGHKTCHIQMNQGLLHVAGC